MYFIFTTLYVYTLTQWSFYSKTLSELHSCDGQLFNFTSIRLIRVCFLVEWDDVRKFPKDWDVSCVERELKHSTHVNSTAVQDATTDPIRPLSLVNLDPQSNSVRSVDPGTGVSSSHQSAMSTRNILLKKDDVFVTHLCVFLLDRWTILCEVNQ